MMIEKLDTAGGHLLLLFMLILIALATASWVELMIEESNSVVLRMGSELFSVSLGALIYAMRIQIKNGEGK